KLKENRTRNKHMKQLTHPKSTVATVKSHWLSMLSRLLLAGCLVIGPTDQLVMGQGNRNPGVIPPHARAYGLSYAEWGAQWWRWAYSFPVAQFPPLQSGELDCSAGQSGPVWFLAGTVGQGPVTRSCTIPTGKALFIPIITYLNDYPIMLSPLPPGSHTIFIHGVIDFGGGSTFEVQVTYNLTVGP